jgi:hypothetical protein
MSQFSSVIWAAAPVAVAKNRASMPPGQCQLQEIAK